MKSKITIQKVVEARKVYYDKKGRISTLIERIKKTEKYKKWRISVFRRDNYTCQNCGRNNCYVEAHHKIPKSILLKKCDNDFSKAMKYKELWLVDNGMTLCKKCHRDTPTFGTKIKQWS